MAVSAPKVRKQGEWKDNEGLPEGQWGPEASMYQKTGFSLGEVNSAGWCGIRIEAKRHTFGTTPWLQGQRGIAHWALRHTAVLQGQKDEIYNQLTTSLTNEIVIVVYNSNQ